MNILLIIFISLGIVKSDNVSPHILLSSACIRNQWNKNISLIHCERCGNNTTETRNPIQPQASIYDIGTANNYNVALCHLFSHT